MGCPPLVPLCPCLGGEKSCQAVGTVDPELLVDDDANAATAPGKCHSPKQTELDINDYTDCVGHNDGMLGKAARP